MAIGFWSGAAMRQRVVALEERWFDRTRHVQTAGNVRRDVTKIVGEWRDSEMYVPVRVANAAAALREVPVRDHAAYTFVDIGSGKGRVLFLAAEYPYRAVRGVEFSDALHAAAVENIAQYRYGGQRCRDIASLHDDAAAYEFPAGNLVVMLFNPFGPVVMGKMVENLARSLEASPRHVVIVLVSPWHWEQVAGMKGMRRVIASPRYHLYEVGGV